MSGGKRRRRKFPGLVRQWERAWGKPPPFEHVNPWVKFTEAREHSVTCAEMGLKRWPDYRFNKKVARP